MELKSTLTNIPWPENREYKYILAGMGGSGEVEITYGSLDKEIYMVHVSCIAKVSFLASFHFEGLTTWEKTQSGFSFISYEEKDFSKDIHKKWEMLAEGLNYIENKKGLVLEREVQYFNTPENIPTVFDPISAVTLCLLENPNREINVFGKQRILQIKTQKIGNDLQIETTEGLNPTWTKILGNSKIVLDDENHIDEIEIPSPIQIGKIKMKSSGEGIINKDTLSKRIASFKS